MKILLLLSFCLLSLNIQAQTNTSPHWELAPGVGYMIPGGIKGVKDTYTLKGFRLSTGMYSFRPDIGLFMAEEDGVKFYHGQLSLLNSLDALHNEPGLKLFWLVGLSYSHYKVKPRFTIPTPEERVYQSKGGAHLGYGAKFYFTNKLSLRIDGVMNVLPGRFFHLWTGISYDFGASPKQNTIADPADQDDIAVPPEI